MIKLDYDIKLIGMGGTIDKSVYSYDHFNYIVADPQAPKIIASSNVSLHVVSQSLVKKDSLELTDDDRALLRKTVEVEPCNRIIITHGTDTIPLSAKALEGITNKTIVFVGAMLPARFIDSDASFNIGAAVLAVQTLPSGLYLVMHGTVFDPLHVTKDREQSLFLNS